MFKLFYRNAQREDEWEYGENDELCYDAPEYDESESYGGETCEEVWDDGSAAEEYYEEEYYVEEEFNAGEEYFAEEEYDTGEEYYAGEEYDTGEEYYAGEEFDTGEEYYAGEEYDTGEEYYAEEEFDADILYIDDGENGDYPIDRDRNNRKEGNFFTNLWYKFINMSPFDKVVAVMGAAVLVLAVATVGVYISAGIIDREIDELATVGSNLQDVEVLGDAGLMAVADAKAARMAAAQAALEAEKNELKEYDESEYSKNVTVALDMVSVYKDLKIKFIDKGSGKLISNVPFSITATKPDGRSETWSDDDMDGIIYKKDITAGTYKVAVNALSGDKYEGYTMPASAQSAEVKKEIAYEKVNVTNEIKKESEVNAKKEDTAQKNTAVESSLQDTVAWVESTAVTSTYREVAKSSIAAPMTQADAGSFVRMAGWGWTVSGGDPSSTPAPGGTYTENVQLDKTSATVYVDGTTVLTATLAGASRNEVGASSSDSGIADVSVSGNKVTVTGKSEGSVTVTVTHPDRDDVKAACTVTVKGDPRNDRTTKLKDNDGNQLYVNENNEYREAVCADYYTFNSFYVRGDTKYTGWQTIDGKVYFFTADGNKVTGEQIIQGARYNFASDGSLVTGSGTMGIDVSKWNGSVDWNAVKNSGVSYVIIRCGYRGSSQGALIDDPTFAANIKGATAAGLKVGVYFFTQAVDEVEAVEEASMVLDRIKGYKISYPIFLDVEPSGGRADSISADTRTAVCKAFCETIQNAGYTAGIYANKTWLTEKLKVSSLSAYKIWLAQYAATPNYTGRYDLWQYKSTGKVSGISGSVDMNISYLGY